MIQIYSDERGYGVYYTASGKDYYRGRIAVFLNGRQLDTEHISITSELTGGGTEQSLFCVEDWGGLHCSSSDMCNLILREHIVPSVQSGA